MPNVPKVLETVDPLDLSYTGDCPDSDFIFHSPLNCNLCEKMLRAEGLGEILLLDVVED